MNADWVAFDLMMMRMMMMMMMTMMIMMMMMMMMGLDPVYLECDITESF